MGDPTDRPLTLPQVAEIAEVEYPRLHSWLRRGLLSPSVQASTGTGSPNLFSMDDALKARILADLRRAGVGFPSLAEAAGKLDTHWEQLTDDAILAVNGSMAFFEARQPFSEIREAAVVYPVAIARAAINNCN